MYDFLRMGVSPLLKHDQGEPVGPGAGTEVAVGCPDLPKWSRLLMPDASIREGEEGGQWG